jgi:hypothetical protein
VTTAISAPARQSTNAATASSARVAARRPSNGPRLLVIATLFATSLTFGLPHIAIPILLGPDRPYTPFAVSGVSSVTYDESATYAALLNYTSLRFRVPYDTDVWETQNVPVPVTSAPFFALAVLGEFIGGVQNVFILCDFLLPPLAVLSLYLLLSQITGSRPLALVGSLATIFVAFGPRNFLTVPILLAMQQTNSIVQPMEFSRLLHPELSFTLFAVALLLLWWTLQHGNRRAALLGGVVGGLLCYTYIYYFPVWLGACALLVLARPWLSHRAWIAVCIANASTWLVSIPFWLSIVWSHDTPNFTTRLARHYSDLGHIPPPEKIMFTCAYIAVFAILVATFLRLSRSSGTLGSSTSTSTWASNTVLFHSSIFIAGIVALNGEVILGFNLEAMSHYANRFFQPFLLFAGCALAARPAAGLVWRRLGWSSSAAAILAHGAVAVLFAVALTRQIVVAVNVADAHELRSEYRLLFDWLSNQTRQDDVVLASPREINDLIPVFTHNLVFVPNGERTSAGDAEIERRFLIAMRLLQRPQHDVQELLAQDHAHGDHPLGLTYTYFLFVSGNGSYDLRLPESKLVPTLARYREMNLAHELEQRRLDYVYGHSDERPAAVPGWIFRWVYGNTFGNVWQVERATDNAGNNVSGRL